ncbi:MAG TPA: DMT family transporter [Verrucomicrobiae bacterium]
MFPALLTTFLFATSAICGYRTSKQIGGVEANFWRIALATLFLTGWAFTCGHGFAGAPGWFFLSGFVGIGIGDSAYFQALPRLGSRRTILLCQCLTAPFAVLIEYLFLGATLHGVELGCIAVILAGVGIALKPDDHLQISARDWRVGVIGSTIAALCTAVGSVLIRKGYQVAHGQGYILHAGDGPGMVLDAGTTGYQRVLGGILIPTVILLVVKWRSAQNHGPAFHSTTLRITRDKWRRIWPWVLANALAGQTLGVTCMQWALKTTQAGIVSAIIATTPVVLLPMTLIIEKEKIRAHSVIGAVIAVLGVIGLTWYRLK